MRIFKNNLIGTAIIIFIMFFMMIQILKPSIIFKENGELRQFGIARKQKTILPIWLFVFIFAIVSYLIALYLATI